MAHVWRTQVAIVGGGPAGLLLGHLLHRQGVDSVTVYGQTEVVKDLIAARVDSGTPLHFECAGVQVSGLPDGEPIVAYTQHGERHELRATVIAGCDGFRGVCRQAIPSATLELFERVYPFAWLGILADVAPSTDELIYARHARGFALHSIRSPSVSRLYLRVAHDEDLAQWPDDPIWDELHTRLATDGWSLEEGPVTDRSITPMRTQLRGRADALLRRVWRAQHFSWWMTSMLHVDPDEDPYGAALQRSQLDHVCRSVAAATSLAENYVGFPLPALPDRAALHG